MTDRDEAGLQTAIKHGFTEEQYRAAKSIEARIFGSYQWQNQGDRAASMVVAICQATREAEQRGMLRERAACVEIARGRERFGEGAADDTDDVEKTHFWWGYRDAGEAIADTIIERAAKETNDAN